MSQDTALLTELELWYIMLRNRIYRTRRTALNKFVWLSALGGDHDLTQYEKQSAEALTRCPYLVTWATESE